MRKIYTTVFFSIFLISNTFAQTNHSKHHFVSSFAPASPDTITYIQQDGSRIDYTMKGDGLLHYNYTLDGYSILFKDKNLEYAIHDSNGDLVPSGIIASNNLDRTNNEIEFLTEIQKKLTYSSSQVQQSRIFLQSKQNNALNSFPTSGTNKTLFILIDFSDKPAIITKQQFENLGNQDNFNNTGSVKQYYRENSFGQFDLQVDVYGWYRASQPWAYYGSNDVSKDANARELAQEALAAAEADGVDFSQYDNDGDGVVDGIQFIHAGGGEEAGAGADAIWSHSWYLDNINYDNVTLSPYTMNPELYGSGITSIGVICHEFGHNLGLPDFYDTDYTSDGLGEWDMMAGGSWNNNGRNPANHNAWSKYFLGWQTPTVINTANIYTLDNAEENNVSYRVNTGTANEYFLLENRQKLMSDKYLPGHGLIIFHVDENYINNTIYYNNVNNEDAHQGLDIEEADAVAGSSYDSDPFPGMLSKTSFTDGTNPSSKAWDNNGTLKPITSISENNTNKTITFTFMGGGINTPITDFNGSKTTLYPSQTVDFTDFSINNPTSWKWTFEGATPSTSTLQNPTNIRYNETGNFQVKLVVTNSYGSDSLTKTGFIKVANNFTISNTSITTCSGFFFDEGGSSANYPNSKINTMTFFPESPDSMLQFRFLFFNLENTTDCTSDYLDIYDGSTTLATKIGRYCGSNKPPIFFATNPEGAITFRFKSNNNTNATGWHAQIKCVSATSISDNYKKENLSIYPNPSNQEITLNLENTSDKFDISIFDMNGKLARTFNAEMLPYSINIESLPNGIYHIKAVSVKNSFNSKFVKF